MPTTADSAPPDALLLVASGCTHCHAVLDALAQLAHEGALARLEVVNINVLPEVAQSLGARSVPWTRLGPFELVGALPAAELAEWAELAASGDGWPRYYAHLIESHRLERVTELISARPGTLINLLDLLANRGTPLALRIGISAVVEGLAGIEILRDARPAIELLALSESPQTRADACHFLGLAGDPAALPAVERLLDDDDTDVREIAAEARSMLHNSRHR